MAPARRRGHPDRECGQPAGDVARRVTALRRAPTRGGRSTRTTTSRMASRTCASRRCRRAAPTSCSASSPLEPRRPIGCAQGVRASAELCNEPDAHDMPADDGSARRPAHVERLRAGRTASRARLGRFVDLAPVRARSSSRSGSSRRSPSFSRMTHGSQRLRDAYLEPWGRGLEGVFALAMRVGIFAHAIAWLRQRDHLPPKDRAEFRLGVPDRSATGHRSDEIATALRRRQGPGPDGTRPPYVRTVLRLMRRAWLAR